MPKQLRGEYWIISGSVESADVDVNDIGHEGIARNYIFSELQGPVEEAAEHYGIDIEDLDKYGEIDTEKMEEVLYEIFDFIQKSERLTQAMAMDKFCQTYGCEKGLLDSIFGGDPVFYCMKNKHWIAVRENNVELYGWNEQARKSLSDGLYDIITQDFEDEDEEMEIYLYDHKTKKHMEFTLKELEQPISLKSNIPNNTKYKKSFFHQYSPRDTEENKYSNQVPSNPNKFNVAAQKNNMIGPGQNAWRGTSESKNNNFKEWLNKKNDKFKK